MFQKLVTFLLLINPLKVLGLINEKPQVRPAGDMVCAPLSQIEEAMHAKDFTIPKWVSAEEVVEQNNLKTFLLTARETIKPIQNGFTLIGSDRRELYSNSKAERIQNWVKAHENNTPAYSTDEQCYFMVRTSELDRKTGMTTLKYCTYSAFIAGIYDLNPRSDSNFVEAPWNTSLDAALSQVQRDCGARPGCP